MKAIHKMRQQKIPNSLLRQELHCAQKTKLKFSERWDAVYCYSTMSAYQFSKHTIWSFSGSWVPCIKTQTVFKCFFKYFCTFVQLINCWQSIAVRADLLVKIQCNLTINWKLTLINSSYFSRSVTLDSEELFLATLAWNCALAVIPFAPR